MPAPVKEIVAKLYKPPADGGRQILVTSRAVAEKLPRVPGVALISITAPGRPIADVDGFDLVLRMSFADVDFLAKRASMKASRLGQEIFSVKHAEEIKRFVCELPGSVRTLLIHCEGGYSRSAGVALALHQLCGYQTDLRHLKEANPSIVQLMTGRFRWGS